MLMLHWLCWMEYFLHWVIWSHKNEKFHGEICLKQAHVSFLMNMEESVLHVKHGFGLLGCSHCEIELGMRSRLPKKNDCLVFRLNIHTSVVIWAPSQLFLNLKLNKILLNKLYPYLLPPSFTLTNLGYIYLQNPK